MIPLWRLMQERKSRRKHYTEARGRSWWRTVLRAQRVEEGRSDVLIGGAGVACTLANPCAVAEHTLQRRWTWLPPVSCREDVAWRRVGSTCRLPLLGWRQPSRVCNSSGIVVYPAECEQLQDNVWDVWRDFSRVVQSMTLASTTVVDQRWGGFLSETGRLWFPWKWTSEIVCEFLW